MQKVGPQNLFSDISTLPAKGNGEHSEGGFCRQLKRCNSGIQLEGWDSSRLGILALGRNIYLRLGWWEEGSPLRASSWSPALLLGPLLLSLPFCWERSEAPGCSPASVTVPLISPGFRHGRGGAQAHHAAGQAAGGKQGDGVSPVCCRPGWVPASRWCWGAAVPPGPPCLDFGVQGGLGRAGGVTQELLPERQLMM